MMELVLIGVVLICVGDKDSDSVLTAGSITPVED